MLFAFRLQPSSLTVMLMSISSLDINQLPSEVYDAIKYPLSNLNGAAVKE